MGFKVSQLIDLWNVGRFKEYLETSYTINAQSLVAGFLAFCLIVLATILLAFTVYLLAHFWFERRKRTPANGQQVITLGGHQNKAYQQSSTITMQELVVPNELLADKAKLEKYLRCNVQIDQKITINRC